MYAGVPAAVTGVLSAETRKLSLPSKHNSISAAIEIPFLAGIQHMRFSSVFTHFDRHYRIHRVSDASRRGSYMFSGGGMTSFRINLVSRYNVKGAKKHDSIIRLML